MYKIKSAGRIWSGLRSAPAVDRALSGLPNPPGLIWLKLGDVGDSVPKLCFFSKTLVHAATQIKKGSTAPRRECGLIAPSRRYHKLLVFFLCTSGSLYRPRCLEK